MQHAKIIFLLVSGVTCLVGLFISTNPWLGAGLLGSMAGIAVLAYKGYASSEKRFDSIKSDLRNIVLEQTREIQKRVESVEARTGFTRPPMMR